MNETDKPVQWHAIEPEAILERLQAEEDGLDATRADQLRAEVGANSLEVEEGTQPWKLLLRQLNDPLVALLGIAALVSFLIGHRLDAVLILVVIVANTLLGLQYPQDIDQPVGELGGVVILDGVEQTDRQLLDVEHVVLDRAGEGELERAAAWAGEIKSKMEAL